MKENEQSIVLILLIKQMTREAFTVRKSTFRMTCGKESGRILPPHNFRVHVSKFGA